jgi:hypothetical protein
VKYGFDLVSINGSGQETEGDRVTLGMHYSLAISAGADMDKPSAAATTRFEELAEVVPEADRKLVFGGSACLVGGNMFFGGARSGDVREAAGSSQKASKTQQPCRCCATSVATKPRATTSGSRRRQISCRSTFSRSRPSADCR